MAKFFASLELKHPHECGMQFSAQRQLACSQLIGSLAALGIHGKVEELLEDGHGRLEIEIDNDDIESVRTAARNVMAITEVITEADDAGSIHLYAINSDIPEDPNFR